MFRARLSFIIVPHSFQTAGNPTATVAIGDRGVPNIQFGASMSARAAKSHGGTSAFRRVRMRSWGSESYWFIELISTVILALIFIGLKGFEDNMAYFCFNAAFVLNSLCVDFSLARISFYPLCFYFFGRSNFCSSLESCSPDALSDVKYLRVQ